MTTDFLQAIGAVSFEFATLEQQVHSCIWSLLVGPKLENQAIGQIVTAGNSFRRNLELLGALVHHRCSERTKDFKALYSDVQTAEENRNIIVHSTWALAEDEQVLRIKTAKGKLRTNSKKMTLAHVEAIAHEIHAAAEAVLNFHLRLSDPNHPSVTL